MNINKTQTASALNLALEGRLDTTTAPQLEAELKSLRYSAAVC
jgi:anti-sigma B factor antagonist